MLNRIVIAVLALTLSIGASAGASAQGRHALVLGNSNYKSVTALPNPVRDARAISQLLDQAGFEVVSALDLGQADMRNAVRDFARKFAGRSDDTVALIYFAGHGVQIDGQNYLLPVDANIEREADVPLAGVNLAHLMSELDSVPGIMRIVILDACRNNPFEEIGKTVGRGLAIVNAPAGTVVAYSTSPGATAEDGTGANSPFTAALIEAARNPGAGIESVLQQTRLAVHKATGGRQTPWEVTALTRPFAFFPGAGSALSTARLRPEKSETVWRQELRSYSPQDAYDLVVLQDNVIVYQIFVSLYGQTPLGRGIRGLLDRRLEMQAWFAAVNVDTAAAFEAFLARYPQSDLAATAKKLTERAKQRSLMASNMPGANGIVPQTPEVRTVVKEVVREVKVPFEVVREVKVPFEVVREVKVPVVKEVIKEVKVPVVKEVIREVKVPVVKEVVRTVTAPCNCPSGGGGGQTIQRRFR